MERKLKCYFVEAKGHDEPNGVAVIAYTAKDAKKYAWSTLMEWIDWIDMRPTISKHANIEGLEEGHVFDCDTNKECWDALFRKVYASLYYVTCPRCKTEDTDAYYARFVELGTPGTVRRTVGWEKYSVNTRAGWRSGNRRIRKGRTPIPSNPFMRRALKMEKRRFHRNLKRVLT